MDTAEAAKPASLLGNQQEGPSRPQGGATACETSDQTKTKKKKKQKSGKKKPSDSETRQKPAEENQKEEEPSPEEQLDRELNWCIEQLQLGMTSQKGTPKQKEEASRALKTLRSSKAPLVKKRQLMRALTGDYRKKMEEEKNKQFQLIQSETASAQVKVVSDSPKKSIFHRRAEAGAGPGAWQVQQQQRTEPRGAATQEETPAFSFVPSQEEFHFNFF
uniref:Zgc:112185 n=2 Tax=Poecilia reticulata TaxID=8081 RepID=A0A3P9PXQ6_POERE